METTKMSVTALDKCHITGANSLAATQTDITNSALEQFKNGRHQEWNACTNLNLSGCKNISDNILKFLPRGLITLDLSFSGVTGEGFHRGYIISSTEIDRSYQTVRGMVLPSGLHFPSLTHLNMRGTQLSDTAIANLPTTITHLDIRDTNITLTGFSQISCNIQCLKATGCPGFDLAKLETLNGRSKQHLVRLYLKQIKNPKGFIWAFTKKGKPTHYLAGICHFSSEHMAKHPGFVAACKNSRICWTERKRIPLFYPAPLPPPKTLWSAWGVEIETRISKLSNPKAHYALDEIPILAPALRHLPIGKNPQIELWNSIAKAWIFGDLKAATQLENMLNSTYLARFRNTEWVKQLQPLLETAQEPVGIFPGYLHTVGPSGVKSQLETLGWQFTRMLN